MTKERSISSSSGSGGGGGGGRGWFLSKCLFSLVNLWQKHFRPVFSYFLFTTFLHANYFFAWFDRAICFPNFSTPPPPLTHTHTHKIKWFVRTNKISKDILWLEMKYNSLHQKMRLDIHRRNPIVVAQRLRFTLLRDGSRVFKREGSITSAEAASFLGGSGVMFPQNFLKIWVSQMTISSILRQISYSFNIKFCS